MHIKCILKINMLKLTNGKCYIITMRNCAVTTEKDYVRKNLFFGRLGNKT